MKKIFNLMMLTALGVMLFIGCKNSTASGNASTGSLANAVSGSGNDTYLEMSNDTKSARINFQMLFKGYLAHDGKGRMEMYKLVNGKPVLQTTGLSDVAHPGQSIILDETEKTYSINLPDTNNEAEQHAKYTVAKIGNEKVLDYDCVHARVIATKIYPGAASFMNSVDTTDLWLSKDVAIPDAAKAYMNASLRRSMGGLFNNNIGNQLKQMGCEGFLIKSNIHSKKISSVTQLTKLSKENFASSMFEIPAGYKKTE